jgi:hypothetical protein
MQTFRLVCFSLISFSIGAVAQLPELRDLNLSGWDCLTKLEGAAKTQDGQERNRQKNRSTAEVPPNVPSLDTTSFLTKAKRNIDGRWIRHRKEK